MNGERRIGLRERAEALGRAEVADQTVVAMARETAADGFIGAATPVGLLAALLARRLYAPGLIVIGASGAVQVADRAMHLSLSAVEWATYREPAPRLDLPALFERVYAGQFHIWIRPAQLDASGSANISCIGPWERPKVALVGARGLPDDGVALNGMTYYVPWHQERVFVSRVDFVGAPGWTDARAALRLEAGVPVRVVSDLGVFSITPDGMRAVSLHPGVSPERVRAATGFPVMTEGAPTTPPPDPAERRALEEIDPLGVRYLEFLPAGEASAAVARLWEEEEGWIGDG